MSPIEIIIRKYSHITVDDAEFALQEVGELIRNYCGIDEIPRALSFTWANMAIDVLRAQGALSVDEEGNLNPFGGENVSEFRLGDMTIKFGNRAGGSNADSKSKDFTQYQAQLNKFRRLVW